MKAISLIHLSPFGDKNLQSACQMTTPWINSMDNDDSQNGMTWLFSTCLNKDRINSIDWNGKPESDVFATPIWPSPRAPCGDLLQVIYDVEINLT